MAILKRKMNVVFWSEILDMKNENEFWTSKMAGGDNFEKNESCVLIWNGEKCKKKQDLQDLWSLLLHVRCMS
jgi:hypothetical protein